MDDTFKNQLSKYDGNALPVKPVYDVANNVLHYQTDPYLAADGTIKVKRLASYPVVVEAAFNTVAEYTGTQKI